jgi:pyridoxine kinase
MSAALSAAAGGLRPLPVDVISIQSQVVYGSVGNSIAIPALQRFGLQVASVPTALLSNTPHYSSVHGGAMPNEWFAGFLDDLEKREALASAQAILVGYLGSQEQAQLLADWLDRVCPRHPQLRVHIDPVIGDFDHDVYTAPGMIQAWQDVLLPRAHGLTPNHFELERLAGRPLPTLDDCFAAAAELLQGPTEWVIITSVAPTSWPSDQMHVALVTRSERRVFTHAHIPSPVKGGGDLFSAQLTGWLLSGLPLTEAVERASQDVVAALTHTHQHGWEELALPPALSTSRNDPPCR